MKKRRNSFSAFAANTAIVLLLSASLTVGLLIQDGRIDSRFRPAVFICSLAGGALMIVYSVTEKFGWGKSDCQAIYYEEIKGRAVGKVRHVSAGEIKFLECFFGLVFAVIGLCGLIKEIL